MNKTTNSLQNPTIYKWLALVIVLAAFGLRMWKLDGIPPGWRDDELINSLVISQHALDGELAVYYADASGHEALYHLLNAVMLGLFGPNIVGIRVLSVFLGTLTVALTYQVGRRLFSQHVGLIAAAGLAFSFWSLMYSRIGLRHILTPPLLLLTIYFFWKGIGGKGQRAEGREIAFYLVPPTSYLIFAGIFMSLGMYTYFASRGVPLILAAFCGFLVVVDWARFKRHWVGLVMMFGVTAVLSLPLFITLSQQPESEARVAELAVPVVEARQGNFEPLIEYTTTTLSMFHSSGDGEWLYNIPDRPIFGGVGAVFFWMGVVIAVVLALRMVVQRAGGKGQGRTINSQRKTDNGQRLTNYGLPSAFLIAWWLAGVSPGFISVPPASLGHTILAQPATFILVALPIGLLIENGQLPMVNRQWSMGIVAIVSVVLLGGIAVRDWTDYFGNWTERGMVRFLYRGDYHDMADYLNATPDITDVGVTGLLAGPWDKLALASDLDRPVNVRWYNPQRVVLLEPAVSFIGFPDADDSLAVSWEPVAKNVQFGDYALMGLKEPVPLHTPFTCFQNGLCVSSASFDAATNALDVVWVVERPLSLPNITLISNPPPPNVYAGPRLSVFAHLLDADGNLITGDDGLWVDVTTLQAGDVFWQQHRVQALDERVGTAVSFGLYDPMTGERILTDQGADHVQIEIEP